MRKFTDEEIEWCSERVRYYIRKCFTVPMAIERAIADLRALNS
jgi:hypothetical protein